jgi:hypothetical protein
MSIFMKATLKIRTPQLVEFLDVLENNLVPMMEDQGWRLHGTFVQRFGSMQPTVVVDLWEMEDMAHVERVLKDTGYRTDKRYLASQPVLESAVIEEQLEFMQRKFGRMKSFFP